MKVRATRSHRHKDEKRATMVVRKKGDEFTLDQETEGELIFNLLTGAAIEVIDNDFIPPSAKYRVLSYISYETKEGFPSGGKPGDEVALEQSVACRYMVSGHVKPVSEKQWRPLWLLGDVVKQATEPKRMFDEEPPRENWVKGGRWKK